MRTLFLALLALSASSIAHAQQQDVRVAEFRNVCIVPTTFEAYAEAAQARGWTTVDSSQSRVATLVQMGQSAMPGAEFQTFTYEADGAQLDLMLTRVRIEQVLIQGCGVFHSGGSAVDPTAFSGDWLIGAPVLNERHGASIHQWNQPPGLPGVFVVKLGHVPAESELGRAGYFTGLTMSVDRVQQ